LRYDTRAPFGSVSSWSTFNSSMLDGASGGTVRLFLSARGRRMCVC
jgi:hypothetical protein